MCGCHVLCTYPSSLKANDSKISGNNIYLEMCLCVCVCGCVCKPMCECSSVSQIPARQRTREMCGTHLPKSTQEGKKAEMGCKKKKKWTARISQIHAILSVANETVHKLPFYIFHGDVHIYIFMISGKSGPKKNNILDKNRFKRTHSFLKNHPGKATETERGIDSSFLFLV